MTQFAFKKTQFLAPIRLETHFNRVRRRLLATSSVVGILFLLLPLSYVWLQTQLSAFHFFPILPALPFPTHSIIGGIFVLLGVRLFVFAINRFISSTTFDKHGKATSDNVAERLNYFAAELWFHGVYIKKHFSLFEFLASLPETEIGATTLMRLGISHEEYDNFLENYTQNAEGTLDQLVAQITSIPQDRTITAGDLLACMVHQDQNFRALVTLKQADEHVVHATTQWVEQNIDQRDQEKRWWSREKIGRIPGIAKTWAYGPVFTLMQFATSVNTDVALMRPMALIGSENQIKLVEDALLSQGNANVVIVGDPGAGKETLILGLTQMILQGKIFPELESKRVFTLAGPQVVATGKTKGAIEAILIKILNEAARAGDIILVIQQFPEFIESLNNMGIIASQVLEPYLKSSALHIIALADTTPFRRFMENNAALMAHFQKIEVSRPNEDNLLYILQDMTPHVEAQARGTVILTYPALKKIAEAGVRYLVDGVLPERAITLMEELISYGAANDIVMITPELVAEYVGKKTKIPLGSITTEEQDKLMHLEDLLHGRVIGQSEAIDAIANTIRRARAGIVDAKRPIGSFLFLGPTGVGKTETAKALAAVYFGDEDTMIRFDMTEYQTEDSIERLIGSFQKNEPGILASRMRSSPYGALLLDEFEKADKKVVDLFLQILDEGFFSDAFGQQVNMRNTIIIATSNAGAQLIWQMVQADIKPNEKKSELIAQIQQEGKFKPELLNRFDSIIIFQPLSKEQLKQVATLMLHKLAERLETQQDITFVVTDAIIDETVRQGYNPVFGARPMRRFIQDKVEKVIAEKIITHKLARGESITLDAQEIA